jgi:hypothetical protein
MPNLSIENINKSKKSRILLTICVIAMTNNGNNILLIGLLFARYIALWAIISNAPPFQNIYSRLASFYSKLVNIKSELYFFNMFFYPHEYSRKYYGPDFIIFKMGTS